MDHGLEHSLGEQGRHRIAYLLLLKTYRAMKFKTIREGLEPRRLANR